MPWPKGLLPNCGQLISQFRDRKSTRLNSSHQKISYAVFCLSLRARVRSVAESASAFSRASSDFPPTSISLFFFNDTATTEIYTLSLHDALPICSTRASTPSARAHCSPSPRSGIRRRSEEHTSELQSPKDLVCRLLLEKKKK